VVNEHQLKTSHFREVKFILWPEQLLVILYLSVKLHIIRAPSLDNQTIKTKKIIS